MAKHSTRSDIKPGDTGCLAISGDTDTRVGTVPFPGRPCSFSSRSPRFSPSATQMSNSFFCAVLDGDDGDECPGRVRFVCSGCSSRDTFSTHRATNRTPFKSNTLQIEHPSPLVVCAVLNPPRESILFTCVTFHLHFRRLRCASGLHGFATRGRHGRRRHV